MPLLRLSLEKAVQSLAEQLPGLEKNKDLQERQRTIERWLMLLGGGSISILVLAILWAIIYKIIILKGEVLEGSIFVLLILALVAFGLLGIYHDSLTKASAKRQLAHPATPEPEDTKELPESHFEPVPSIIERTTELLAADKKGERTS